MEQIEVTSCPCCGGLAQAIKSSTSSNKIISHEHRNRIFVSDVIYRAVDLGRSLTFTSLRNGNMLRLPQFKNRHGQPAHSQPDGSDWTIAEWGNAMAGETGEACNIAKKIRRGDFTHDPALGLKLLLEEIADVVIYADIVAFRAGGSLGDAVRNKFNSKSKEVSCDIFI